MPSVAANGIELFYESSGDPSHPPLLLVSGLGIQLVEWGEEVIDRFVAEGFRVIAYDHRDIGLSTHMVAAGVPDLMALLSGDEVELAYGIPDMALDAARLLGALDVRACHVVGVSMGGMVAQQLAVDHPGRVLSLCSIMSTTGAPDVGAPSEEGIGALLRPAPRTRQEAMDQAVETWKIIGSPHFPIDEDRERALAGTAWDRSSDQSGFARQLAAILTAPDRTTALGALRVPTLVIHGGLDPLVDVSGGRATAAAVPGSRLVVIDEMGHHVPPALWDRLVAEIVANATSTAP